LVFVIAYLLTQKHESCAKPPRCGNRDGNKIARKYLRSPGGLATLSIHAYTIIAEQKVVSNAWSSRE
jgi:hypothetical protein